MLISKEGDFTDVDAYKKIFDKYNGIIKLSDFTAGGFHNTHGYKFSCLAFIK